MPQREVLFEGLSEEQILALPQEHIERLILLGEPLVFRVGSAEILGSFKIASDHLVVELAQIEGGGEGILISLASLAKRYVKFTQALRRGMDYPCGDVRETQSVAPPGARTQGVRRQERRRSWRSLLPAGSRSESHASLAAF